MKKTFFYAICVMVLATIVAVVSCKKEKNDQLLNNTEQAGVSADNMDEYLISFKKKLLSAEKGGETISLEQAERDLGNLLNFDFGDANYATDVYQFDTICLKLSTTNDEVELSQLALTYGSAIEEILEVYREVDLPEKSVCAISCVFNKTESKDGDTMDVEIVLITRGFINGFGFFYEPLDWKPQNHAGTCDGQHYGYGAPEVIEKWIRDAQIHMACQNGGRIYYTDCGHWTTSGYKNYDPESGCFLIYTSMDPCHNTDCVTHDEMVYYANNILSLWNNYGYSSREIFFVKIDYCYVPHGYVGNQLFQFFYTWRVTLEYRKPNCTDTEPIK